MQWVKGEVKDLCQQVQIYPDSTKLNHIYAKWPWIFSTKEDVCTTKVSGATSPMRHSINLFYLHYDSIKKYQLKAKNCGLYLIKILV